MNDMDKAFDMEGYSLDYDQIMKQNDLMAVTRLLAATLQSTSYINVGEFIKELSDADLQTLVSSMDRDDDHQYDDLIVISEMLATGEGCDPSKTVDDFMKRMNHLVALTVCESLARKGLVKVFYENMSFGEDMGDKVVVERL